MTVYIILTIAGADVGPFDLYSNAISPFFDDPPFETGVSRDVLVAGYYTTVPDGATQIKVQSTGNCTNYIIIDVGIATTTTSSTTLTTSTTTTALLTTTTTTTEAIVLSYSIPATDCPNECPHVDGSIKVNGTSVLGFDETELPLSGTISANAGDTILISSSCYSGGSGCVGVVATVTIMINGVQQAYAEDDTATYSFTFSETTLIEIILDCLD